MPTHGRIGNRTFTFPSICQCEGARADRDRKAAEAEKSALDNAVGAALERSGMAPIFQRVAPIDAFAQAFADGGTVYLHGPVGSGKTTTAAGIAKWWLYAHAWNPAPGHYTLPPVRFTSSVRILAEFKDS